MAEEGGGFDVQAWQRSQSNPDKALLVTFEWAPVKQRDGSFENVEMVRIWLGRGDEIVRPVTPEDRVRFRERYESFRKGEEVPPDGTPISQCAFATPADVSACKAERIFTLEQLVEIPDERLQRARLLTFKYRCKDWLDAQRRHGYVGELRAKIEKLEAENLILKQRLKEEGKSTEVEVPKRRGRPPKARTDGNTALADE